MFQGFYQIKDYVFDYCELPTVGVYGKFGSDTYLIQDEKDMACIHFFLEFREEDDACDGDDEESDEDEE